MAQQLPLHFEFTANQTFNDFFTGPNNEIVTHLQQCIANQGEQQIFLWGKSGQGKSHLLQACCHHAQSLKLSSFYLDLSNRQQADPSMLIGLDEYDIVCFDNIECVTANVEWELAFFNFFNRHRDRGHKLILSACSLPSAIAIQLPDLKTRLNWGLTLKILPLTDNEQIAALIFKADQMGFEITVQAGQFLLTHYDRDPASIWALLEKLDKASLSAKRKLTIPFLKQILDSEKHG
jgi:DnaA family protein